jgi:Tat protein translocase TatB subunit
MDFFGIGTGEILLIIVIALIIWGPHRLPEITHKMGRAIRILRRASQDFTAAISREINLQEGESSSLTKETPGVQNKESRTTSARTTAQNQDTRPARPESQPQSKDSQPARPESQPQSKE